MIRIAFVGVIDMGDIADKLALACLDDGAEAPCFWLPGAPAEVQT